MAGAKRPAVAKLPSVPKQPGCGSDPELAKHNPLGDVGDLHRELVRLESQALFELERRQEVKQIPVAHVVREAQDRLKAIKLEEADTLWELRLNTGRQRVWGLVEGSTFFLLWWDPEHTVCTELPKNVKRR